MRSRCARDAREMRSRSRLRAPLQESEIEAAVSSLGGAVSVVMAVNKMTRNVVSRRTRAPRLAHCAHMHTPALRLSRRATALARSRLSQTGTDSTTFGGRVHTSQRSMSKLLDGQNSAGDGKEGATAAAEGATVAEPPKIESKASQDC